MSETNQNIEIKEVADLYYYFVELKEGRITGKAFSCSMENFLNEFNIILSYKDRLGRLTGTIDNELAQAIIDFQEFIYEAYKVFNYQDSPITLSDDEKSSLKIYVKISNGSTEEVVLGLKEVILAMVDRLDGEQVLTAFSILIWALTVGGLGALIRSAYAKRIDADKEIEILKSHDEAMIKMFQEETKRNEQILKGFNEISNKIESRPLYLETIKMGKKALLKPVKNNNSYKLGISDTLDDDRTLFENELIIDNKKAKKILKTTRSQSEISNITDNFIVKYIEALEDDKYKIKLISSSSDIQGIVEFSYEDENIDFELIMKHMANREPIRLVVTTKTLNNVTTIEKMVATINSNIVG